ncbi:hypothetical protein [Tropicimonas sp. S265A]|uniref:hypothetical protein n=1 Tax=Tropicimonas sp. S265A TaxID=3415134 RepID=UPI003C7BAAC7
MTPKRTPLSNRVVKLGGAVVICCAVAGCEVTSVGVGVGYNYGYNSPFYWNDYYRHGGNVNIDIDVDNRPGRPDRPARPDRPKPPVAKPPNVRPPTHKPTRPSRPGGRPGGGRGR